MYSSTPMIHFKTTFKLLIILVRNLSCDKDKIGLHHLIIVFFKLIISLLYSSLKIVSMKNKTF